MIVDNKVMKYVIFKKRTEHEVITKLKNLDYSDDTINDVIEYLKESEFIDDKKYVEKYIKDIINLKKCSVLEIKYDLLKRGVADYIIEDVINQELYDYELSSAIDLALKKSKSYDIDKIKRYLANKGYSGSNISKAIDNLKKLIDN